MELKDNFFSPKSITVKKGQRVTFRFVGRNPHNVMGNGARSKTMTKGTYRKSFRRSGRVVCTIHGGMTMKIRVR